MARCVRETSAFGPALRRYRLLVGLTQAELAEAARVSVRTVRNLERGTVAAQRRTAELLADALDLDGPARQRLLAAVGHRRPGGDHDRPGADPARIVLGLPPDLPDFVGREAELDWLLGLSGPMPGADPAGAVAVVSGPAGAGKSTLLVRAAHRLADRLGGRVCYLSLSGVGSDPLTVDEALAELLGTLGVAADQLPVGAAERRTLFRMLTAGGPGLLVLDNVSSEEQVRSLLPSGRQWLTLVSSRGPLAGLAAVRRSLDPLSAAESRLLLATLLGAEQVARSPVAAADLARSCGRLPLALRSAAALLAGDPQWTIEVLAERLRDERHRVELLGAGDPAARRAFDATYRRLGDRERLVLRRLAQLPGTAASVGSVATVTGLDPADVVDLLESLADAGLLDPVGQTDAYVLPEPVGAFAREYVGADEPPAGRDRAPGQFDVRRRTAGAAAGGPARAAGVLRRRGPAVSEAAARRTVGNAQGLRVGGSRRPRANPKRRSSGA